MQHLISWKQYFSYSGLCLCIYYAFIVSRFYRNDLIKLKLPSPNVSREGSSKAEALLNTIKPKTVAAELQDDQTSAIKEFSDELDALLRQSAIQQLSQSPLVAAIIKLALKYPAFKGTEMQPILLGLIETETKNICKFSLSEEELALVWT